MGLSLPLKDLPTIQVFGGLLCAVCAVKVSWLHCHHQDSKQRTTTGLLEKWRIATWGCPSCQSFLPLVKRPIMQQPVNSIPQPLQTLEHQGTKFQQNLTTHSRVINDWTNFSAHFSTGNFLSCCSQSWVNQTTPNVNHYVLPTYIFYFIFAAVFWNQSASKLTGVKNWGQNLHSQSSCKNYGKGGQNVHPYHNFYRGTKSAKFGFNFQPQSPVKHSIERGYTQQAGRLEFQQKRQHAL